MKNRRLLNIDSNFFIICKKLKHNNILFYIMDNIRWNIESKEEFANILDGVFDNRKKERKNGMLIFEHDSYYDVDILEDLISVGLISDLCCIIIKYLNSITVNYKLNSTKYVASGIVSIYFDISCNCDFKYVLIRNYEDDPHNDGLFGYNKLNIDIRNSLLYICGGLVYNIQSVTYSQKSLILFLNEFTKNNNMKPFYHPHYSPYSDDEIYCRISGDKYIVKKQITPMYIRIRDTALMKNIVTIMTLINDVTKKYI